MKERGKRSPESIDQFVLHFSSMPEERVGRYMVREVYSQNRQVAKIGPIIMISSSC